MIPQIYIESWRTQVPWQTLAMVEQDMVISRALIDLYNQPQVQNSLIFRGGTALNKLIFIPPARYSEDIDFVQRRPELIGETINAIRNALDPWLGNPKRKLTERSAKLVYQYSGINNLPAKLKVEINTTEHFQVLSPVLVPYSMNSDWFKGDCTIVTYELEELLATKLRALYQRRKGRDLFDLWFVFSKKLADVDRVIQIFHKYCKNDGIAITKDVFHSNMIQKRLNIDFQVDMSVLLPHQTHWNFDEAFEFVLKHVVSRIDNE